MTVHPAVANFYMTLLATELSTSSGIGLLTDTPSSERLSTAARLDAPPPLWPLREFHPNRRRNPQVVFDRSMPRDTAQGLLAQLTLKQLTISKDTPVKEILNFKRDHKSELGVSARNWRSLQDLLKATYRRKLCSRGWLTSTQTTWGRQSKI